MKKDFKKLWILFISTFSLSAFTFGGGFVIIPLMRKKFVEELGWIDEQEMLDLTAIAQSSPGAVAVNASIATGYRVAGYTGTIIAIIGTVLPPLIIITLISIFYNAFRTNHIIAVLLKSMRVGVAAVIFDVVLNLGNDVVKNKSTLDISIMVLAFVGSYILKINIIIIVISCIVIGIIRYYVKVSKVKRNYIEKLDKEVREC